MKTKNILLTAFAICASALCAAGKTTAGPHGGRLLETNPHQTEFFVNSDGKVEITFYDEAQKVVPPANEVVAVIAEPTTGRIPIALEKTATGFVSTAPLPSGEPYRVVVQVRESPEAKAKNFRIDLRRDVCAECQHAEYACTCEGH